MGAGPARSMASGKDIAKYELNLVPWAGVAVQLQGAMPVTCDGHAFVFLPLPVGTQLPVHINGFFELSENRRDLWYGDGGMTGGGRVRSGTVLYGCHHFNVF